MKQMESKTTSGNILSSWWRRVKAKLILCRDILGCNQYIVVTETYHKKGPHAGKCQRMFVRNVDPRNEDLFMIAQTVAKLIEDEGGPQSTFANEILAQKMKEFFYGKSR